MVSEAGYQGSPARSAANTSPVAGSNIRLGPAIARPVIRMTPSAMTSRRRDRSCHQFRISLLPLAAISGLYPLQREINVTNWLKVRQASPGIEKSARSSAALTRAQASSSMGIKGGRTPAKPAAWPYCATQRLSEAIIGASSSALRTSLSPAWRVGLAESPAWQEGLHDRRRIDIGGGRNAPRPAMCQRISEKGLATAKHAKAGELIEHRLGIGEVAARILNADNGVGIAHDQPRDERTRDRNAREMRNVIEADLETICCRPARSLRR